jgi:putative ABC transport system permease protein
MSRLRTVLAQITALFRRRRGEAHLSSEITAHLEWLAEDHRRQGMSPEDARLAARRDFGGIDQMKEQYRDQRGFTWIDAGVQDVRYALRMLRRTPAFTLAAVSTLALGIGATTAIFSVANAALLRPLPYPHWEDLRTVRTRFTDGKVTSGLVAPLELNRLSDPRLPILHAAASARFDATLLVNDKIPRSLVAYAVSNGFFELIGLPPALGAGFSPEHFRRNGPGAVVISQHLWHEVFGGDPGIVGKTLRLASGSAPIVGVAAGDMDVPQGTDVWFNLQLDDPQSVNHSYEGYIRLRPGTSPELLRDRLAAVADGLGRDFPGPEANRAFVIQPLVQAMVGDLRPMLVIVLAATGLLLLLACVNVANLLMARAARRTREMAVRTALGASRLRIVRQLLTESVVFATAGAVFGVLLAYVGVRMLLVYGAAKLPRLETVPFDMSVLVFAGGMLLISALGVGLAPALQLAGSGIERLLRESGRALRGTRSTHRALQTMIVAEIAVAVVMVAGTGWLVRSFTNLQNSDPGFVAQGRLVFDLSLPFDRYRDPAARSAWTHTLLDRLRNATGVVAVASSSDFPMRADGAGTLLVQMDGWSESHVVARMRVVSPGFFEAMGIRMRSGRAFTDDDRPTTAPVMIVNESFVRKYLDGRDPMTAHVSYGFPRVDPKSRTQIVGVVSDVKYASLWNDAEPTFFLAQDQSWNSGITRRQSIVVSTSLDDPSALIPGIRADLNQMDPQLAFKVEPVTALVAATLARQKLGMTLMLLFGAIALVLAAIGIYGVIAYASAERLSEVATRMALGATSSNIFWLLARQGAVVAAVGAILGVGAAYAAGQLASTWLYKVRSSDPAILALALALVLAVTLFATLIPVGRASRVDPAVALRQE